MPVACESVQNEVHNLFFKFSFVCSFKLAIFYLCIYYRLPATYKFWVKRKKEKDGKDRI